VKVDESGMTLVDFQKVAYEDEPFIMAYQDSQVFYVADPAYENWHVVLHGKKRPIMNMSKPMKFSRLNHLYQQSLTNIIMIS